jgi:O-antigen ligase
MTEIQVTKRSQFDRSNWLQTAAEWLLVALIFTSYTRLSDALIKEFGLFSIAEVVITLLVTILVVRWLTLPAPNTPARLPMPILLLVIYGLLAFASLLYAEDSERAMIAIEDYAKDAFIVILVLVSLRRASMLRHVIWTLLAAGLLMGGLSLYQQLTGNFAHNILGLAEANRQQIVGQINSFRIAGPVGDPNFFAQIMLVLVPLALDRLWHEKKTTLRALAGLVLVVSLLTIVFTFSRGAFIGLLAVFVAIIIYYRPRPTAIILAMLLVIPLLSLVPRSYIQRLETIANVLPWSKEIPSELALRGRLSEVTVGWLMFQDYPLAGVGVNNYPTHYLDYSSSVGLDPRLEARPAHSLYLQVAAETGILGILLFGSILWLTFRGLLRAPAAFRQLGLDDSAEITHALTIGLMGYLVAATFLHAAYPRYMWLLLGIALAIPNIIRNERRARQS